MAESCLFLLFCSALSLVNPRPKEQQNLEITSLTVLYSNVRGLHQAYGELCKSCLEVRPSLVCLTETHLHADAADSFCPPGYVIVARQDRTKYGGRVLILTMETILFDEDDTFTISSFSLVLCSMEQAISPL